MDKHYRSGNASLFAGVARNVVVLHDGDCLCGTITNVQEGIDRTCACGVQMLHYHCLECGGVKPVYGHVVGGKL